MHTVIHPLHGLVLALLIAAAPGAGLSAPAGETDEACAALYTARARLLEMVDSRGRGDMKALKREVYASSAKLEGIVGGMTGPDADRAAAFRPVWEAFKATREQAILPALQRRRYDEARALAYGIQAERMEKMKAALGCR